MTLSIESNNVEFPNYYENLACLKELSAFIDWTTVNPSDSIFPSTASKGRLTAAHVFAYVDLRFPNPKGETPIKPEYKPKSSSGRYSKKEIIAKAAQQQSSHPLKETNFKEEREASLRVLLPLVEVSYTKLLAFIKNGACPDFVKDKYVGGTQESFEFIVKSRLDNLRDTYGEYLQQNVEA